jgi:serine/threonine protein kinase
MNLTSEANSATTAEFDELEPRDLLRGTRAGNYRILGWLGNGGMADVYEAEHERLGSLVAIKFLRTQPGTGARGTERFRGEARRVAALRSDHVVRVFDYGELPNGVPYLVMERLFGRDLKTLLQETGPLPARRAVKLAIEACRGISVAHAAGLVHRDLKPANLFVEQTGEGTERCKVLDFGVAKWVESDSTRPGALLGTVCYMAPEQLENAAGVTPAADVYALGAILYEMLAGVPAHQGETPQAAMFDVLQRDPPPLSKLRSVPSALEAIIGRALSRDQTKRFETIDAMALALKPFASVGAAPLRALNGAADTLGESSSSRDGGAPREVPRRWPALMLVGVGAASGWLLHGLRTRAAASQISTAATVSTASSQAATPPPRTQPSAATPRVTAAPPEPSTSAPSPSVPSLSVPRPTPPVRRLARPTSSARLDAASPPARYDPRDPYE